MLCRAFILLHIITDVNIIGTDFNVHIINTHNFDTISGFLLKTLGFNGLEFSVANIFNNYYSTSQYRELLKAETKLRTLTLNKNATIRHLLLFSSSGILPSISDYN